MYMWVDMDGRSLLLLQTRLGHFFPPSSVVTKASFSLNYFIWIAQMKKKES